MDGLGSCPCFAFMGKEDALPPPPSGRRHMPLRLPSAPLAAWDAPPPPATRRHYRGTLPRWGRQDLASKRGRHRLSSGRHAAAAPLRRLPRSLPRLRTTAEAMPCQSPQRNGKQYLRRRKGGDVVSPPRCAGPVSSPDGRRHPRGRGAVGGVSTDALPRRSEKRKRVGGEKQRGGRLTPGRGRETRRVFHASFSQAAQSGEGLSECKNISVSDFELQTNHPNT